MKMFRTAILTVLALMFFTATWVFAALIYTLFLMFDWMRWFGELLCPFSDSKEIAL